MGPQDGAGPYPMRPIGHVRTGYRSLTDTPIQTRLNPDATGVVVVEEDYEAGLLGLDGFDHAWLVTALHLGRDEPGPADELRPTPFLATDPNFVVGVFATRYPVRPNPIGLSLVRLDRVEGRQVHFAGVDLVDGTPVLDIKPWVPAFDLPDRSLVDQAGDVRIGWYRDSRLGEITPPPE